MELFIALVKDPTNIEKQKKLYCKIIKQYFGCNFYTEFYLLSCSEFLSEQFPYLLPDIYSIINNIKKRFVDYSNIVDDPLNFKKNTIFNLHTFPYDTIIDGEYIKQEYNEKIITYLIECICYIYYLKYKYNYTLEIKIICEIINNTISFSNDHAITSYNFFKKFIIILLDVYFNTFGYNSYLLELIFTTFITYIYDNLFFYKTSYTLFIQIMIDILNNYGIFYCINFNFNTKVPKIYEGQECIMVGSKKNNPYVKFLKNIITRKFYYPNKLYPSKLSVLTCINKIIMHSQCINTIKWCWIYSIIIYSNHRICKP